MSDWKDVGTALLGSWPSQVASWGREAIAAYVAELEARGLTPDGALVAIRSCPAGQKFPPSAPELAALARRDPSVPSFDEAWQLIRLVLAARTQERKAFWEPGERDAANEQAMLERALQPDIHPLVADFIVRQGGPLRFRALGLDDPENEFREARRHELRGQWSEHCERVEGREVTALAGGRGGELGRFDPLAALGGSVAQIGSGDS